MGAAAAMRFGLIVRSAPFDGRSGRDQLDVALAAAGLGYQLELVFLGAGELQLLPDQQRGDAALPPGARAWASLSGLTEIRGWVAPGAAKRLGFNPDELLLPCATATPAELAVVIGRCDRVLGA